MFKCKLLVYTVAVITIVLCQASFAMPTPLSFEQVTVGNMLLYEHNIAAPLSAPAVVPERPYTVTGEITSKATYVAMPKHKPRPRPNTDALTAADLHYEVGWRS